MKKELYVEILGKTLVPIVIVQTMYPEGHKIYARQQLQTGLELFTVMDKSKRNQLPPELPNPSPIENLWQELKEYILREVKPTVKDELVKGIIDFWKTVEQEVHQVHRSSKGDSSRH